MLLQSLPALGRTLVVGQRLDTPFSAVSSLTDVDLLENISMSVGRHHSTAAIDYFFIAHNQFPWQRVPDVIVGRPSYDNFIVCYYYYLCACLVKQTKIDNNQTEM